LTLRILILLALGAARVCGAEPLTRWDGWPGPVQGALKIPHGAEENFRLLTAGAGTTSDELAIRVTRPGRIRVVFSHGGQVADESAEVEVGAGQPHRLVVSMGSLLPPLSNAIYWSRPYLLHLAGQLLVMIDGKVVLGGPQAFAASTPQSIVINDQCFSYAALASETEVAAVVPSLMARSVVRDAVWRGFPGPVRLVVRANDAAAPEPQPLLSTGRLGAGDLIYWIVQADGRARIGFKHAGAAAIESEALPLRAGAQEILISADGLLPPVSDALRQAEPGLDRLRGKLFVELNGRVAFSRRLEFHLSSVENIVFGADVVESRPTVRYFEGAGESLTALTPEDVIAAGVRVSDRVGSPSTEWAGWPGPVRLQIKFPTDRDGIAEPLLCTGVTGAADLVYVRYVDPRHVRLAFDHWGVGGPVSDPVEIDPDVTQEIVVSFGALFPPATDSLFVQQPAWLALRHEVRITLNGRMVIAFPARSHPSAPEQIVFGHNPVGASSCVPDFSGTLVGIHFAPAALTSFGK
jgi:hypothetical protein